MTERDKDLSDATCEMLDAFLDDRLAAHDAEQFQTHLAQCTECAGEVELQQLIDRLLARGDAAHTLPRDLIERVTRDTERAAYRQRIGSIAALLLAAVSLVGISQLLMRPRPPVLPVKSVVAKSSEMTRPLVAPSRSASARPVTSTVVVTGDKTIAIQVKSDSPKVHLYRVFSTVNNRANPDQSTE